MSYVNKYYFLIFQPSAGSEMKPLTYDRRYHNVLLGQGYRTARGAVTWVRSNVGMILTGETEELGEKPVQYREPGLPRWEGSD
jgi:hypothetical protein